MTPAGELPGNLIAFARLLRDAGLPIGTGRALDGVRAVAAVDPSRRDQFYWALSAVFVSRREHRELFDQAFAAFWKEPSEIDPFMAALLDKVVVPPKKAPYGRRVAEALAPPRRAEAAPGGREDKVVVDSSTPC
jgi:uncharacterized protein with von Willebrand factor type A (vWA) domain